MIHDIGIVSQGCALTQTPSGRLPNHGCTRWFASTLPLHQAGSFSSFSHPVLP